MTVLTHLLPLVATWQHPGTATDRYGNTVDDWSNPTEADIAVWVEQRGTQEVHAGRDAMASRFLLITDELAVAGRDRITNIRLAADDATPDGLAGTFEVEGDPAMMFTPRGTDHLEATLLRVAG